MKRKIVWMVVSGWMVVALLLTSCAPAVVGERETNMVKWTGTKMDGTVVEKMIEKPRYGGVHIVARRDEPQNWDDALKYGAYWPTTPVVEALLETDWLAGPAGTGEWKENVGYEPDMPLMPNLATGWERPDPETLIYHIRQGVHFTLDPTSEASQLVGGREVTAADVVYNSVRNWTIGYYKKNFAYLADMENPANSVYVSPTDKWAVVFKSKPGGQGLLFRHAATGRNKISATEVIEKYKEITDWRHVVGTGPFILKNYVSGSAVTYAKNPDYWGNDPFFPENQLPYLDGFKVLIIPDASTLQAALRTGKIDYLTENVAKEDADALLKTNPELKMLSILASAGGGIFMRLDKPELPWHDIRVRRALAMAINNQEILDQYWGGDAELFTYPVAPKPESIDIYIPLEEMPRSVQELFEYHPDQAKQLLAEAGYPQGFKTEILTEPRFVDMLSIIKAYWTEIGVELNIEVRDSTVMSGIRRKKSHTEMLMHTGSGFYASVWSSIQYKGGGQNYSIIDDPWHPIVFDRLIQNYFDGEKKKEIQLDPMGEGVPSWPVYANEQAWFINLPQPYTYRIWQPWLKGHSGAISSGFSLDYGHAKFTWIDQELKEAMGY